MFTTDVAGATSDGTFNSIDAGNFNTTFTIDDEGALALSGALTNGGAVTVTDADTASFQAITADSLTTTDTTTSQTFNGALTIGGAVSLNSTGSIDVNGNVTAGGTFTSAGTAFDSAGFSITTTSTTANAGNITLTHTGDLTLGNMTAGGVGVGNSDISLTATAVDSTIEGNATLYGQLLKVVGGTIGLNSSLDAATVRLDLDMTNAVGGQTGKLLVNTVRFNPYPMVSTDVLGVSDGPGTIVVGSWTYSPGSATPTTETISIGTVSDTNLQEALDAAASGEAFMQKPTMISMEFEEEGEGDVGDWTGEGDEGDAGGTTGDDAGADEGGTIGTGDESGATDGTGGITGDDSGAADGTGSVEGNDDDAGNAGGKVAEDDDEELSKEDASIGKPAKSMELEEDEDKDKDEGKDKDEDNEGNKEETP